MAKSVQTQLGVKCLFKSSLTALASTPAVQQVKYGFLAAFGPHLVQDLGGVGHLTPATSLQV